jgi:hypothetical protein
MQDNVLGYVANDTIIYMATKGLYYIFWLANSPNFNSIEEKYPEIHRSCKTLREVVKEAWNAVAYGNIIDLIKSMLDRCKAVIAAGGWHTEY